MFNATYPASFLREENGQGFHVRFPDLPEALTGGADLADTYEQAADCWPKRSRAGSYAEKKSRHPPR